MFPIINNIVLLDKVKSFTIWNGFIFIPEIPPPYIPFKKVTLRIHRKYKNAIIFIWYLLIALLFIEIIKKYNRILKNTLAIKYTYFDNVNLISISSKIYIHRNMEAIKQIANSIKCLATFTNPHP